MSGFQDNGGHGDESTAGISTKLRCKGLGRHVSSGWCNVRNGT